MSTEKRRRDRMETLHRKQVRQIKRATHPLDTARLTAELRRDPTRGRR